MRRDSGSWSVEPREDRGDLINAYKYLKSRCKEDGVRLFSVASSDRIRNNDSKLQQSGH